MYFYFFILKYIRKMNLCFREVSVPALLGFRAPAAALACTHSSQHARPLEQRIYRNVFGAAGARHTPHTQAHTRARCPQASAQSEGVERGAQPAAAESPDAACARLGTISAEQLKQERWKHDADYKRALADWEQEKEVGVGRTARKEGLTTRA